MALSGLPVSVATVVAGLGGRPITKTSLRAVFESALRGELRQLTFLDLNTELVERELERMATRAAPGPTAENMLRDLGAADRGSGEHARPLLPSGELRRRQPAGQPFRPHRAVRRRAHELADLGPSRLPGLWGGPGRPLRPRRRHAGHGWAAGGRQRDRLPGGVLHALSRDLVADRLVPLLVRQRAGGGDRCCRRPSREGPRCDEGDRAGRRRRDGRHRVRLSVGHVRAQRRRPLHLLRQRGLHEHRRAAVGGDPAGSAHGNDRGGRPPSGERLRAGQEHAGARDGAPDPLRGHRDGGRPARPRGEGHPGDGDPRRPLHPHPGDLPAGLGSARATR